MAPPAGKIRPGRYLAFFVLIIVSLYSLVFFTGDRDPSPKLGIDLQGGTRVTLTARTPDGEQPSNEQLEQARQIIETRVNGIGVTGAEVVLDGSNVVITVPGEEGEQARNLGRTAKLGFRTVVNAQQVQQQGGQNQQDQQGGQDQQEETGGQGGQQNEGGQDGAAQSPQGGGGSQPQGEGDNSDNGDGTAGGGGGDSGDGATPNPGLQTDEEIAEEIERAKQERQNPALMPQPGDQAGAAAAQQAQQQAMANLTCQPNDPLVGNDDPNLPLVTCSEDGNEKYVLGPVFLEGTEIDDSTASYDPQQGWVVNLQFLRNGAETWADYTSQNVGQSAAFVLDSQVVSAPRINSAIPDGQTQISGDFTQEEAQNLADILQYGSLPLSFESSDALTVSPTLGLASLEAGLIAGAIGIALVFVYCLAYYRMLGVLTVLSLVLSGAIVYAVLVLLGRWIGFTLDLAGVAGFIIAIGVTADSFVVYFERLKDEMRDGKSFRSAVPRAWARARRTILASDAIMFLCAAVLYVLAVGEVRGFAFTLGMSTVLDLIVVFLVTHPLVAMVAKSKKLSSPKLSGLGTVQRLGQQRRGGVHISQTKTKGA